jgi:PAS domain S-box-containing protein
MAMSNAAGLRHALRTPLNHVIGYSEMLAEDAAEVGQAEIASALERIRNTAREILDLIQSGVPQSAGHPEENGLNRLRSQMAAQLDDIFRTMERVDAEIGAWSPDLQKVRAAALSLRAFAEHGTIPGEPKAAGGDASPARSEGVRGHLLVVDDDESNREILTRRLKRDNYRVSTAPNGAEALRALGTDKFDIVLLDIAMPEMNGFEVLDKLKADPHHRSLPVIVISALDDMQNVVRCIEMGAEDFIPKPFDPVLLRARIGAILNRRRAEAERADLAENFRLLLESTGEGIYGVDTEGNCTFVNAAASAALGYSFEQLAGRNLHALLHHTHSDGRPYPEEDCPIHLVLQTGRPHRTSDDVLFRADGSSFPVEYSAHPIWKNGDVRGAVVTFTDISERKQTEERLRQAAKHESLGVLAGGVAHDFNNLLTGILGNASLVVEALRESDPNRSLLMEVIKASERAADLTRQMLAFAGKGRFVVTPVNVSELVEDMRDLLLASIPKMVRLDLRLAREIPPVDADPDQIRQLLLNLVINAGEAIGPDTQGVVTIETGTRDLGSDEVAHMMGHEIGPGLHVYMAVQDNGPGMDESTRARIFYPFYTTKFMGRGLGLPATLGIVRGHRGAMRLDTSPGQGARFEVYLPPAHSRPQRPAVAKESARAESARTILVVDDEEIVRRTAQAALERYDYPVLLAENGQAGVEIFRQNASRVALILLDLTMPVMGGEEASRYLRAIRHDVPILISSGYNETEVARRFTGRGIAGFVQKPFNPANLIRQVRTAIAGQRVG